MGRRSFSSMQLILASACALLIHSTVFAQVVIDMPVPKKVKARGDVVVPPVAVTDAVPGTTVVAAPQPVPQPVVLGARPVDVGDIALSRYANARTYPQDTYHYGDRYAGIRQYGYPYDIWWGWGFPVFGNCGNKFTGCVGSSHCH